MVKHTILTYLLLSFTLLSCSVEQEANNNSFQPILITVQDNVERVIYDYTQSSDLGLNKMQAPVGWTEPIIKAQFELRGIVLEGVLGLEFIEGVQQIEAGLGFVIPKDTKVRIFNAGEEELILIEVLRPAYDQSLVKSYDHF
jgi:hypothetical protein